MMLVNVVKVSLSYLTWSTDFLDIASAGSECSLAPHHVCCIAHHKNTDKGVTIPVPAYDSFIIVALVLSHPWN